MLRRRRGSRLKLEAGEYNGISEITAVTTMRELGVGKGMMSAEGSLWAGIEIECPVILFSRKEYCSILRQKCGHC